MADWAGTGSLLTSGLLTVFNLSNGITLVQAVLVAVAAIGLKRENYQVARRMACAFFIIAVASGIWSTVVFLRPGFPGAQWWWIEAAVSTVISGALVFGILRRTRWVLLVGAVYLFSWGVVYSMFQWIQPAFQFGSFQVEWILEPFHIWVFVIPILMNLAMVWVLWRMFRWAPSGCSP